MKNTYEVWTAIYSKTVIPFGHDDATLYKEYTGEIIGYNSTGFPIGFGSYPTLKKAISRANYYLADTIIIERPTNKIIWDSKKA